jgi:hypothetical protein
MSLGGAQVDREARRPLRDLAVRQVRRRDAEIELAPFVPLLQPAEQRTSELADGVALRLLTDAMDEHHADARRALGLGDEVLLDRLALLLHQATRAPRW